MARRERYEVQNAQMPVLLVRHGIAVSRKLWSGSDEARPLDERGRLQAEALIDQLEPFAVVRVASSPAVRCVDTVNPTAHARGVDVEERKELAEGEGRTAAGMVRSLVDDPDGIVLCTHGDVIGDILGDLGRSGARLDSERCRKGSIWVIETDADGRILGSYLPPAR